MVEYHEDETVTDGDTKQTPVRRRRTFQSMPLSDADAPGPLNEVGDPVQDTSGAGGDGHDADVPDADVPDTDVPETDVPDTDEVLPPPPAAEPLPLDDDDHDGAPDGGDEQGEPDVIVPAGPDSTEPADRAAETSSPRRPPMAVLFQAPPAIEQTAEAGQRDEARAPRESQLDVDDDESVASRRRRRTHRRASGGQGDTDEPTTEVVAKVRPPREQITEPQKLKGSTRLEAKRQRRRDGRDAGRRRTVVTEAEFLARREAVERVMLVRTALDRIEIGVLEDGVLAEHYVAKSQNLSLIGNVYLGRVQNVLPSMEAAFVDIGRGRNAVLYSGEVDWEAASDRLGDKGSQARKIELALRSGDQVLVQVTKDPIGHKGARLTSAISLPGRYLVYVPNGSMSGISRKLPDTERARLKKILKDALPDSAGVIVRTAAEGATEEQLTVDVQRLANQWAEIDHLVETASAPAMLHGEPDLLVKIVRDVFNEDFSKLIIEGDEPRATIERYLQQVAPDLLDRLETWAGHGDVFAHHRVVEQIEKALDRKVWLPSGGSLVIDRTEAMTVIDVNTGKFVGSGGNLEETVTKNNLEAAEEIVRQLRLRDIGGIIVIDFIDMVLESNRDLVLRRVVECLSRDRTKHQVAEVTSLGLVQMTRKRLGVGLAESVGDGQTATEKQEQQPQGRRRRSNGGSNGGGMNGGGQQHQQAPVQRPSSTHTITEGARASLAQIAGATIVNGRLEQHGAEHIQPEPLSGDVVESTPPKSADERGQAGRARHERVRSEPVRGARGERGGDGGGRGRDEGGPDAGGRGADGRGRAERTPQAVEVAPVDPPIDAQPATILDLPVEPHEPHSRLPQRQADDLLGSVLEALPAPKAAGQGRRRSRRVSTPTLTAGDD